MICWQKHGDYSCQVMPPGITTAFVHVQAVTTHLKLHLPIHDYKMPFIVRYVWTSVMLQCKTMNFSINEIWNSLARSHLSLQVLLKERWGVFLLHRNSYCQGQFCFKVKTDHLGSNNCTERAQAKRLWWIKDASLIPPKPPVLVLQLC